DTIQDEILTLLCKIADLKVISRTSTQQYQSKRRNMPDIAKQLRVANTIEGSVQKGAYPVPVHVQLLSDQNDSHSAAESSARTWARLSRADALLYFSHEDQTSARRDAAKSALENAQRLQPNSSETLLTLGYYQYWALRDYGAAKTTFGRVSKMLPSSSEVLAALGQITRREGHWDESIAYFEQALALDPRNVELLTDAAGIYSVVRQFPAARKLYDRALDIVPNDPDLMAEKAAMYQAEGNLQEAAKLLANVNAETPSVTAVGTKIIQLTLERNLGEAVRLLQTRQAQFHFASERERVTFQLFLAMTQRLAGDTARAKASAEQARNALEPLYKNEPDNPLF